MRELSHGKKMNDQSIGEKALHLNPCDSVSPKHKQGGPLQLSQIKATNFNSAYQL
jgi:hypothetical protein